MAHCQKCGAEIPPYARFCNSCGQEQPAAAWQSAAPVPQSGLSENAAATLSYVFGWITGIIFFLIDKRPYVRFHAAQSIVTFAGLHIIRACIAVVFGLGWGFGGPFVFGHWGGFGVGIFFLIALSIVGFVLWIICMIKAYQGERFMVPIAGDIAVNLAGRP
jgi:uncharacterized membrane protein